MSQRQPAESRQANSAQIKSLDPAAHQLNLDAPAPTIAAASSSNLSQATIQRALANPRALSPNDILQLQRTVGNQAVQRLLQRDTQTGFEAGSNFEGQLKHTQGSGSPLPKKTKHEFEDSLGADLSNVRIHTNAASDQLNRSIQAKAFTHGNDIHFSTGEFNPTTSQGKHLLAHELTHTIQQTGGKPAHHVQAKLQVGAANDRYEQEADQAAKRVMSSSKSSTTPQAPLQRTSVAGIQRKMDFKLDSITDAKSKKALSNEVSSLLGLGKRQTTFEQIRQKLDEYWHTHESSREVTLLLELFGLSEQWISTHKKITSDEEIRKELDVRDLRKSIARELPYAKAQKKYMEDLQVAKKDPYYKKSKVDKGSSFQYLSQMARLQAIDQAGKLGRGETDTAVPGRSDLFIQGMSPAALQIVKDNHLTDAEIAAIKIYTIDDYKYINPSMRHEKDSLTPQARNEWLEGNLPNIDGLESERAGQGTIVSDGSSGHMIEVRVDSGFLRKGFTLVVSGKRGSETTAIGKARVATIMTSAYPHVAVDEPVVDERYFVGLDSVIADPKNGDEVRFADTTEEGVKKAREEGQRHGTMLNQALMKLPDREPGLVFRGMTISQADLDTKYAQGATLNYGNFTSTARNAKASLKFIKRELGVDKAKGGKKVGMLLELYVKEKGKDLTEFSMIKDEEEVLLMPGTQFRVAQKDSQPSYANVDEQDIAYIRVRAEQVTEKEQREEAEKKQWMKPDSQLDAPRKKLLDSGSRQKPRKRVLHRRGSQSSQSSEDSQGSLGVEYFQDPEGLPNIENFALSDAIQDSIGHWFPETNRDDDSSFETTPQKTLSPSNQPPIIFEPRPIPENAPVTKAPSVAPSTSSPSGSPKDLKGFGKKMLKKVKLKEKR